MARGVSYHRGRCSLLSELLAVAGASRTLLDASIPYADRALTDLLGTPTEQAASQATARALSMAAYRRAVDFGGTDHFGFGCTASLVTDRTKRGQTRAHWAIQTASATQDFYLELDATQTREEQEAAKRGAYSQFRRGFVGSEHTGLQSNICNATLRLAFCWVLPYRWCSGQSDGSLILPGRSIPCTRAITRC